MATIENGRVTRVANNPVGGKYLKGCRRGFSLPLEQNAPDRLLKPLVRDGERGSGRFRKASWDEALRFAAERWARFARSSGLTPCWTWGAGGRRARCTARHPFWLVS
ncbi:MAG: molybdopterin-dependent oxidoreductase [Spirochaetes bacterium]|nr:molybdopterin-dependent oxidoreductase [Spirochaetota bacterium]